jgi:hypothetical protein
MKDPVDEMYASSHPIPAFKDQGNSAGVIVWLIIAIAMIIAALVVFLWPTSAEAQSSYSESQSGAAAIVDTTSQAQAGAISEGGYSGVSIVNNGQVPGAAGTTYSEARIENAPSLGGLALGGGHPCAYSKATGQISIIGGGAGFGGMTVDSACMLMVMGAAGDKRAYVASHYMIASRDPAACKAMEAAGMVKCSSTKAAVAASTKSAPGAIKVAGCRAEDGKVFFKPLPGSDANAKAEQKAACLTSLGY